MHFVAWHVYSLSLSVWMVGPPQCWFALCISFSTAFAHAPGTRLGNVQLVYNACPRVIYTSLRSSQSFTGNLWLGSPSTCRTIIDATDLIACQLCCSSTSRDDEQFMWHID